MKRERLEELVESVSNQFGDRHGTLTLDERIRAALLAVERETVERGVAKCAGLLTGDIEEERGMGFDDGCDACAAAIRSLLTEE